MDSTKIHTVSSLNNLVKRILENNIDHIYLTGEISNLSKPISGHWYFSLKDSTSSVKCAMFRTSNKFLSFEPINGDQIMVLAKVTLYSARGDYQLIIEKMKPFGEGLLKRQYEILKTKLSSEGLFDKVHKKALPKNIGKVGVFTSETGAAIHDILNVLKRRNPSLEIYLYSSIVQGEKSEQSLLNNIALAEKENICDVYIITRGGGSLEDLWSFNSEKLARRIFSFKKPIISAVGHEIDTTITDYICDLRAATPSVAAEIISVDIVKLVTDIFGKVNQIERLVSNKLKEKYLCLEKKSEQINSLNPTRIIQNNFQKNDYIAEKLNNLILNKIIELTNKIQAKNLELDHKIVVSKINKYGYSFQQKEILLNSILAQIVDLKKNMSHQKLNHLSHLNPLDIFKKGYSITVNSERKVIRSKKDVICGEHIETTIKDGKIVSKVIQIN
ncbi:exodeoxyribonuclease VII large subunit [Paraphotobacterium marinum]|uniref:Exodeoxyribonuclease 7 large subunit n=1 Tax=Paraphotobacterium marinum TaxID=1755811 RepID=A0A220VE64_9GAMM|nr:exodeoxyribonuclease VII large subunit [Paraphotobacterium marinum]ASK78452.1 exodeoxyribonuclease VII large subunit [Paraphotobacterium marinum]